MNYYPFTTSFLLLFLLNKPGLEKEYYSYYNPGGAHNFTTKLLIKHNTYVQNQYATSAIPGYRETGRYKIKSDTLILWKDKTVIFRNRKGVRREVIICPQNTSHDCRPSYYLIRKDSLIALYYIKQTPKLKRATFVFVASH